MERFQTLFSRGALVGAMLVGLAGCGQGQSQADLMTRGKYLVEGIVGCGNCHTPHNPDGTLNQDMAFAGAYVITDEGFTAYAPNITPDPDTGIPDWTVEDIMHAVRDGKRKDGSIIGPPMSVAYFYRHISDTDARAIATFIKSVAPVHNVVPKSEYEIPLPDQYGPPVMNVPDVPRDDPVKYGEYLAGPLGHCMDCHTPLVNGQLALDRIGEGGNVYRDPFHLGFTAISANLTPNPEVGLGQWTDEEIKRAITQGIAKDGRELLPFMPFALYATIRDEDLDAIVAYLRSLKPMPASDEDGDDD